MAKKGCCSSVGTAAVVGVSETLIPESMLRSMVPVPCLLESATAWTVTMILSSGKVVGLGRIDGARNVAVPVVCSLESVPKEPSLGHGLAVATMGEPLELKVVVVYVHPTQVTSV